MPQTRDSLDRQLSQARLAFKKCSNSLDQRGVAAAKHRLDPQWRSLRAKCRRLESRLRTVHSITVRDADAATRKAERAAAPPEPRQPKAKAKGKEGKAKESGEKAEKPAKKKKSAAAAKDAS